MIIGCTSKPEAGDAKDLKNFFQKFIYMPPPDYASRVMLWRSFILEKSQEVRLTRGFDPHRRRDETLLVD